MFPSKVHSSLSMYHHTFYAYHVVSISKFNLSRRRILLIVLLLLNSLVVDLIQENEILILHYLEVDIGQ